MGDRRRRDGGGHEWEGETVRSCHPLSASLWAYSRQWREGAVRACKADGVETASFHDHRYAGIVIFCSISLIPEKDRYAGYRAGGSGAGVSIDAWPSEYWK